MPEARSAISGIQAYFVFAIISNVVQPLAAHLIHETLQNRAHEQGGAPTVAELVLFIGG